MTYDDLLIVADHNSLVVREKPLRGSLGRIKGNRIAIKKGLRFTQKACILAEELGHHYTSTGNILDQSTIPNRKQERKAREWAYQRLVPLERIVEASKEGIRNGYELAGFLGVTEEFLIEALEHYRGKYGIFVEHGEYIICFQPLGVLSKI